MLAVNLLCTVAVYATGALCQANILPWYALPVVLLGVFGRWAFSVHSRTHFHGRYPLLEELMLLVMSPLSVGLDEQRSVHRRHHPFLGEPSDPEWLFYNTNPWTAFWLCCWHPEITFFRECPQMSPGALGLAGVRLAVFTLLLWVAGTNFLLWYLLPLRCLFAVGQFVFTWVLHHRQGERTVNLHLPDYCTLLVGSVGMRELRSHVAHHGHRDQASIAIGAVVASS